MSLDISPIPEQAASQATIDMVRSLKGPPVKARIEEPAKALSDHTTSRLIAAAAVGASEAHYPWWTLWLLPVGYRGYREHPREMPRAEAFVAQVRQ